MSLFLATGLAFSSTRAALSTSVSKITPRSALVLRTISLKSAITLAFSGLGIWFGKYPSGSRKTLPSVSAPRVVNTLSTKKPPAPFPASTTILTPSKGHEHKVF